MTMEEFNIGEINMARPNKTGLDYFPFDVDFFEDEKIIAISGEFGIKGEITAIKLLCAIYRNGYFILWNDLLKYKLLRNLPGISPELIESIVNRLVLWEFFDKALFDSVKVLTSRGIQKRYFEASKRRKIAGNFPYLLIEEVCGCVGTESHSSADRIKDARSNASGCGVNVNNNSSSGDEETSSTDGENSANSINVCNKVVNVCNNPVTDDINVDKNTTKEIKGKGIKEEYLPPTPPKGVVPQPKPKGERKKKAEPTLNAKARQVFEAHYKATFDQDYYWSAKDAGNMSKLLDKLKYQRTQKGLTNEDEEVLGALSAFLNTIQDGWVFDNFSVANINSKFNELRAQAINKQHGNSNKNIGNHSADDDEELMRHVAAGIARGYYERQRRENGNGGKSVSG